MSIEASGLKNRGETENLPETAGVRQGKVVYLPIGRRVMRRVYRFLWRLSNLFPAAEGADLPQNGPNYPQKQMGAI